MLWETCSRLTRLSLFTFLLSPCIWAQIPSCTSWTYAIWYWPDTVPNGWICDIPGQGPYSMLCRVPANQCRPVATCPTCGVQAGSPINLTTGNTFIQQTDVRVPGLGGGLSLTRTWNSTWPANQGGLRVGLFGPNWRSTYEERVFLGTDGYMVYSRSDGAFWMFGGSGSSWTLASPANIVANLTAGSTYWTLAFQSGEQRMFDNASGSLIAIVDRNGNTTQLSYDGLNRLTTVTDPASRHLYFGYSGNSALVTAVTSDVGLSLSYFYDAQGRLTTVTKPDQSRVTFEYDSNSLISAVKDTDGKVLESHTYDSLGRGLTSSRANGVDAVSVSYPTQ